jgi:hypothetical protein
MNDAHGLVTVDNLVEDARQLLLWGRDPGGHASIGRRRWRGGDRGRCVAATAWGKHARYKAGPETRQIIVSVTNMAKDYRLLNHFKSYITIFSKR